MQLNLLLIKKLDYSRIMIRNFDCSMRCLMLVKTQH